MFIMASETSSSYLKKALGPLQEATPMQKDMSAKLEGYRVAAVETGNNFWRWIGGRVGWDVEGQIKNLQSRAVGSEAIASFAVKFAQTWRKINRVSLENKQIPDFDEWVTSFLRTFTTSFYYFLFECISDFLLCIVAKIFWRMFNDRGN